MRDTVLTDEQAVELAKRLANKIDRLRSENQHLKEPELVKAVPLGRRRSGKWPLRKSRLSLDEMKAFLDRGEKCGEVARRAGISREAVRFKFPAAAKEQRRARAVARAAEYLLSARFFRAQYRAAMKAAGWRRCASCDEWMSPDRIPRSPGRCYFCGNEHQRRYYANRHGLEFIPNDSAVWWSASRGKRRRKGRNETPHQD